MRVVNLSAISNGAAMATEVEGKLASLRLENASWILMYASSEVPVQNVMRAVRRVNPELPIFGATSFQGVFSPAGFDRGAAMLIADAEDSLGVAVSLKNTGAAQAETLAQEACLEIVRDLGGKPEALLLHATPGFEERILAGIREACGTEVPVYGGSAADDDLTGKWQVFANGSVVKQGFMLAGLAAAAPVRGGFLGGYLPTGHTGTVTRAAGRSVIEIDGQPAASVYNAWTEGAIAEELPNGGSVALKTNLLPVARLVGESLGMPRRLLSHPHEVAADQVLNFFSEFQTGDRITLMTSTENPLVTRVRRVVQRARGTATGAPRAGILGSAPRTRTLSARRTGSPKKKRPASVGRWECSASGTAAGLPSPGHCARTAQPSLG